jgi:hypothetical protein
MAVMGGPAGTAYVGWLSDNTPQGYAAYLRPFSVRRGWLSAPVRVSRQFGNRNVWPGDTIGISLPPRARHARPGRRSQQVMLSWGSSVSQGSSVPPPYLSQIWAAITRPA